MFSLREIHRNLRGGKGIITTHTYVFWFFGRYVQFAILTFDCGSHIGWHDHLYQDEIYITFNRSIRFNQSEKWHFFNVCKSGQKHCANNLSFDFPANVYAIKF